MPSRGSVKLGDRFTEGGRISALATPEEVFDRHPSPTLQKFLQGEL